MSKYSTVLHSTVQYSVVQVSQYSCDDEYVAAQIGCFQYFTGLTGTLQSYNFAGAAQIKVQTTVLHCCSVLTAGCCRATTTRTASGRRRATAASSTTWSPGQSTPPPAQTPLLTGEGYPPIRAQYHVTCPRSSNQVLGLDGVRV